MVSYRLQTENEGIRIRAPRENRMVHRPAVALLPGGLHAMIRSRALKMGAAGRVVAEVVRGAGNQVEVVSSNLEAPLARVSFDDAVRIVSVSASYVRVWGSREGKHGIWSLTQDGARFVSPFPKNHGYLRTRLGDVPMSEPIGGMVQCMFGEVLVHVAAGTEFVFGKSGAVDATVTPMGDGPDRAWTYAKFELPTDESGSDGGSPLYPIPLRAAELKPFMTDDRVQYVVRRNGKDSLLDLGYEQSLTDRNGEGGFDALWSSPGNVNVALLRHGHGGSRRLEIGNAATGWSIAHAGTFRKMEEGDLRWSVSGEEYVAHVRPVDSDGNQTEEQLLVTRRSKIVLPRHMMASEACVDDAGRVAYVRVEENGKHRLVVGSNASDTFPYVWNLSFVEDRAAANVLYRGAIHRIELPYGR